jgi:hypothetical protein
MLSFPLIEPSGQVELQAESSRSQSPSAVLGAISHVKAHRLKFLLCSAFVLIPCFWQHHIQATDLGSHVYNAWLAQIIRQGKAPGVHFVAQHSNVLFDWMLDVIFGWFGPLVAERVAVSIAVLIFFWGGFCLCAAATGRSSWKIVPLLAMTTYGFVFNMGFMNLYLSVGVSLFGIALLWCGRDLDFVLLPPLFLLIWLAHPLGVAGILGLGSYLVLARLLKAKWDKTSIAAILMAATLGAYALVRLIAIHHMHAQPPAESFYWLSGADQLVVYGPVYLWLAEGIFLVSALTLVLSLSGKQGRLSPGNVWLHLYLIMVLIVLSAPGGFVHPVYGSLGYLPDRLSIYTAVLLCCVVAFAQPKTWQVTALAALACLFFARLYLDTSRLDRMESEAEAVVAPLQPADRVLATVLPLAGRIHEQHIIDRACIGHCFYVPNYEPSSGQFRIRAVPGNRVVASASEESFLMQRGLYTVKEGDLPLKEIYSCGPELDQICMYDLRAGELSGQRLFDEIGFNPRPRSETQHGSQHK